MSRGRWPTVPVGPDADRWVTREKHRLVLGVVHNVTSATRLLDVLSVLESDPRIQVVFTWTRSSPFSHGVRETLADLGVIVLPWKEAVSTRFDLAVAASYGGNLHHIRAPLMIFSHGVGYNKLEPGNQETRKPGNQETRKPGNQETRKPGNQETRGLRLITEVAST